MHWILKRLIHPHRVYISLAIPLNLYDPETQIWYPLLALCDEGSVAWRLFDKHSKTLVLHKGQDNGRRVGARLNKFIGVLENNILIKNTLNLLHIEIKIKTMII